MCQRVIIDNRYPLSQVSRVLLNPVNILFTDCRRVELALQPDNRRTRRQPLPFLVNASRNEHGQWALSLPLETLLFWAWQRWELEEAHRELKSNFGLGNKQCWNPVAAVTSVQWSAWVYALLLLAGYRSWGLTHGPTVPNRWWPGSGRGSLNTLWRGYRAALWGSHQFQPLDPGSWLTQGLNWIQPALRQAAFAAARS